MKENKKAKKVVALLLCAVLLVVGSVTGTMAYLTSQDKVVNTFTVGKVIITLDEAKVNAYGQPVNDYNNVVDLNAAPRVKTNEYKLIPNHLYTKDPTIHVATGSEECWLFVKITNNITDIEGETSIDKQMRPAVDPKWQLISGDVKEGVYAYKEKVAADGKIVIFNNFTISGTVDAATLASYESGKNITVQAYAVQADGFNTCGDAWEKASTTWTF